MRFLIVTHVIHKREGVKIGGYGPYVREMNLWLKHVKKVRVIAPLRNISFDSIDLPYEYPNLEFIQVPAFSLTSFKSILKTLLVMPLILVRIFQGMCWAKHIHLRCPGNMGLLGCLVQLLFPLKQKTAKYSNNWDWQSSQPCSYRLQQLVLRSPILTHNMQTLVYGEWPDQTKNIKPFFTATYSESEIKPLERKALDGVLRLVFVGGLTVGKQPLLAAKSARKLREKGIDVFLEFMGEGPERERLEEYISDHHLSGCIKLLGNVSSEVVKSKLQKANFLIFISRSEGWPKVVAESMFWGCVPITTRVSCVPHMLGEGSRGTLIEPTVEAAVEAVEKYLDEPDLFYRHSRDAADWSRQFTLEKFESEIEKLLEE